MGRKPVIGLAGVVLAGVTAFTGCSTPDKTNVNAQASAQYNSRPTSFPTDSSMGVTNRMLGTGSSSAPQSTAAIASTDYRSRPATAPTPGSYGTAPANPPYGTTSGTSGASTTTYGQVGGQPAYSNGGASTYQVPPGPTSMGTRPSIDGAVDVNASANFGNARVGVNVDAVTAPVIPNSQMGMSVPPPPSPPSYSQSRYPDANSPPGVVGQTGAYPVKPASYQQE